MLKAIMAVDDSGGISKSGSMPWPKNKNDLEWFRQNTIKHVVIMGSKTWLDPKMPTPLSNRVNVIITSQNKNLFPGADEYIQDSLIFNIKNLDKKYKMYEKWIIGGAKIIEQLFEIIDIFYLTRIYGNFNCDKRIDIEKIEKIMNLEKKILCDDTCHFEIWKK